MAQASLAWRLEGGYSRFLEGSRVELRLEESPFQQTLDVSPLGLIRRSEPIELTFRVTKGLWGSGAGDLRWRVRPAGSVRALILFPSNAFLGNFRVPRDHFAVQWDIEATAQGMAGKKYAPFLIDVEAGTQLHHTWVKILPREVSVAKGLREAWHSYLDPFDSGDIFQVAEAQVIQWRWSGKLRAGIDVQWGPSVGWIIPGTFPAVKLSKEVSSRAGIGARFHVEERGEFALRVTRRKGRIKFSVRRSQERTTSHGLSAGVSLATSVRLERLGPEKPVILGMVSKALGGPLVKRANRVVEKALVKRLQIGLAAERTRWRRNAHMLHAEWVRPEFPPFQASYGQLMSGDVPQSGPGLAIRGRFEEVRGKRLAVSFNVLDWVRIGTSSEKRSEHSITLGPAGEVLVETAKVLEKSAYRWDEIQFLGLLERARLGKSEGAIEFVWTHGREKKFSYDELYRFLSMALRCAIVPEFALPPASAFPLKVNALLVTTFSAQGLDEVRRAGSDRKWEALVRALEIADPHRYEVRSFWRDWIDYPEVRKRIDRDPVQSHLVTRYPVGERSEFERIQVVAAYRKAKRFLELLERWSKADTGSLVETFESGLDIPVYVFFHLLCPARWRRSAAVLTGGLEEVWGDEEAVRRVIGGD